MVVTYIAISKCLRRSDTVVFVNKLLGLNFQAHVWLVLCSAWAGIVYLWLPLNMDYANDITKGKGNRLSIQIYLPYIIDPGIRPLIQDSMILGADDIVHSLNLLLL